MTESPPSVQSCLAQQSLYDMLQKATISLVKMVSPGLELELQWDPVMYSQNVASACLKMSLVDHHFADELPVTGNIEELSVIELRQETKELFVKEALLNNGLLKSNICC